VNYPNEHLYTRITEFKYLTGQEHKKTSIVYEFPRAEGDPYYPIPKPENAELYKKYKALADSTPGVHFVGRLATYKYYNMDQVVAQALTLFNRINGTKQDSRTIRKALQEKELVTNSATLTLAHKANGHTNGNGHLNGNGHSNGHLKN
jgi:UDP-galactopyranose mutase